MGLYQPLYVSADPILGVMWTPGARAIENNCLLIIHVFFFTKSRLTKTNDIEIIIQQ